MKERVLSKARLAICMLGVLFLLLFSGAQNWASTGFASTQISPSPQAPASRTPIKHIIIIMQENHAFDNFFGTFPNVKSKYALNLNVCIPLNPSDPNEGCVKPFNADNFSASFERVDLYHGWTESHMAYNHGKMNGFIYTQTLNGKPGNDSMGYLTGASIPNYWDYASYYALDANFFSSALSYSYPNHLFDVAARAVVQVPTFNLTFPTIANELTSHGISWKYYAGGWNDSNDCSRASMADFPGRVYAYWNVLPDFPSIQQNKVDCRQIQSLPNLFRDIGKGYLPDVAWITPLTNESDHPAFSTLPAGQLYVSSIINAISSNASLWNSTAIFVTWDEFGGYYDGVKPQQVDSMGYGFRVPLLVISPYVKRGTIFYGVAGKEEDFSSFLSTIEYNWGLANLTERDGRDHSLFYMFNFNQSLLAPLLLPSNELASYPISSCSYCQIGYNLKPIYVFDAPHYPTIPSTNLVTETSDDVNGDLLG